MKKYFALLLALLLLLSLAACGEEPAAQESRFMPEPDLAEEDSGETSGALARGGVEQEEAEDRLLDLTACHDAEEAYRELCHLNEDPSGYLGMTIRLHGVFSVYESHGKTFYYCGLRDEDGCVENLELLFPYGLPAAFPQPGEELTVEGSLASYTVERDGQSFTNAILEDVRLA